jgi:hypothetical protein
MHAIRQGLSETGYVEGPRVSDIYVAEATVGLNNTIYGFSALPASFTSATQKEEREASS